MSNGIPTAIDGQVAPLNDPLKAGEFPGHINVADVRGNYPGCLMKVFEPDSPTDLPEGTRPLTAEEKMNGFFRDNPNRLVAMMTAHDSPQGTVLVVLFTKTLTEDDLREMEAFNTEFRARQEERKRKHMEAEIKNKEEEIKQGIENKRLQTVGRACEEQGHAKKLDELQREIKKLKRGK